MRRAIPWPLFLALFFVACGSAGPSASGPTRTEPATPPSPPDDSIEVRLPPELIFKGSPDSPAAVTFRHESHVALTEYRCGACHPGLFKLVHPERRTSHAEMEERRSCGGCHDGKQAFSTRDPESCQNCHTGTEPAEIHP